MKQTERQKVKLGAGDALVLVDVQKDFLRGGSVAVPGGDEVVPVLNCYMIEFAGRHLPIFAIRDWHPQNHCSFRTQGGRWPVHCVAREMGAGFAPGLMLLPWTVVVSKGTAPEKEACSAFEGTDLETRLRGCAARRLFIGGLATDCCFRNTVKGAQMRGFIVFLMRDAIRARKLEADDRRDAEAELFQPRVVPIQHRELAGRR